MGGREFWGSRVKEAFTAKTEFNEVDFKADLSSDKERLKEHINAMAHLPEGGVLVFGVSNSFDVIQTASPFESIISRITNLARDTQEPPLTVEHYIFDMEVGPLLAIHINSGRTFPIFIKDRSPFGGRACFKRTGAETVPMSVEEIRDLLAQARQITLDETAVIGATISQLDGTKIAEAIAGYKPNESNTRRNTTLLIDNGILMGDAASPQVSVAGWLIFASDPQSIRQYRNSYIEFQQFNGKTRELPVKKKEIKGPLPHQIRLTIEILLQHLWVLPSIVGTVRREIPSYTEEVLREVITNSVVHRDYSKMHQPVKVALFTDRLEIESPGGLLPGLTTYNLIHKRAWRNPLLAEQLKRFKLGEMDGQGIDRLYSATRQIHLPAPIFTNSPDSFKVTLSGPKAYGDYSPIEKQLTVLVHLIFSETVDNETIRETFNIDVQTASTLLKSMIAEGIIEPVNRSKKFARYRLTQTYKEKVFG